MKVYLRWRMSSRPSFPFVFDVSEETTFSDICNMIIEKNNKNDNNTPFCFVKILDENNRFIKNDILLNKFPSYCGNYFYQFDAVL